MNQLFQVLPTPVMVARVTDGQLVYANEHCTTLLKLPPILTDTLTLDRFFEPSAWQVLRQALLQHGCLPNYELQLQALDQQVLWAVVSLQLVADLDEPLVVGVIQETTCSRRLEQALYRRQGQTQAIAEHLPGLMYQTTESQACYWVSGNAQVLLRCSDATIAQDVQLNLMDWVHPDDRAQVQATYQQALTESHAYQVEYRIMTATGETKWVQDQGQVASQEGGAIALTGLWLDITRYKQAEQESRLLQDLIHRIGDATTFEQAIALVLEQVCQTTGWDFGEVWVPTTKGDILELSPAWYGRPELASREAFRHQSLAFRFSWGVGLPGQVWQTQQAQWFPDASTNALFLRSTLAQVCGLKAGFGVPVLAGEEVVAVMVFFMQQPRLRDPRLLQLVSTLAAELGHSLQRKQQIQQVHQAQKALQESQRQLKSLIDALPGMFFRAKVQLGLPISYMSEGCYSLTGYTAQEFVQAPNQLYDSLIHPEDRPTVRRTIREALDQRVPYVMEYRIQTKTGQQKWVWEKGHGVYEGDRATDIEGLITDISDRKAAEEALSAAEGKYRSIFENALEGIFQTTPDGHYLDANPALARIYGYDSPADLMGNLTDIEHQLYVDESQRQQFLHLMQKQGVVVGFEAQVYRRDRSIIWITESAHAVTDDAGMVLYYEGLVMDITDQKQAEAELHQRAFYDPLTDLPNRALFCHRLTASLQRCQTEPEFEFAVLFLDLDRFKVVNDSLGHLVGDQLLVAIARRLESCLRPQDTVARLGGDEFTVLLDEVPELAIATQIAQRIDTALKTPFQLGEHEVFTSTSIGIVWSQTQDTTTIENLLRDADIALYEAKAKGKSRYQIFSNTLHEGAVEQFQQETDLHRALTQNELTLRYQPIYAIATNQLYGFEAQLYWQHPQRGCLAAAEFLPLAEETHLSVPIYRWFVSNVCTHLQQWQLPDPLKIHLHCASQQVLHTHWIEGFTQICQQFKISPTQFRIEVADSFWRQEAEHLSQHLQTLAQQQLDLCIHDFGLGVASLQVLHQQPVHTLKLKASLIETLDTDPNQRDILRIMTILAHQLQMDTLAAGVTTTTQREHLQQLGCNYLQGPLLSRSLLPEEALMLIENSLGD